MPEEIIINGIPCIPGKTVFIKALLVKESKAGGKGFNLKIVLRQGGAVIKPKEVELINISPDEIVIPPDKQFYQK